MKRKFLIKCISLALIGSLIFGTTAYAADAEANVAEEDLMADEMSEEEYTAEIFEAAEIPEEADAAGDIAEESRPEGEAETDAAVACDTDICDISAVSENVTGVVQPVDAESFVGAYTQYTITLGSTKSFTCSGNEDFIVYSYIPDESCTYRLETSGTTGKMEFAMAIVTDSDVTIDSNWTGVYLNNDMVVNAQLSAGTMYAFVINPTTNRSDSGKFKLTKVEKEIEKAVVRRVSGKSLTVGPTGEGEWDVNADGTKNFDVWLFGYDELLSLYTMTIYFKDGTQIEWKGTEGCRIGDTGLVVVPTQLTSNWKLDEKAYCYLYCCTKILGSKQEIPYTDPLFTDVRDSSHPYYKAIYWAANKEITKGYDDGSFGIDLSCTRGHAVMFLWRLAGKPKPKTVARSPFKDVPKTHTYYKAILWASQKGITKGYSDGSFKTDQTCTRGQIMMFIWRFKGQPAPKTVSKSPFKDVAKTHAYYKAILWGSQKGITKGYSNGTFGINRDCTRGQIVTFIYRTALNT